MNAFLPEIIGSLLFCLLVFLNIDNLIKKINLFDYPNARKIHSKKTSLLGGTIIFSYFLYYYVLKYIFSDLSFLTDLYFFSLKNYITYFFSILIIFLIGLYDDKFKLQNIKKLFFLGISLFILFTQSQILQINSLDFSFGINIITNNLSIVFTTILCLAIIIAMNLYDGINLQSGIFYFINFLFLSILLNKLSLIFLFIPPLILFLLFNYNNKIFLGDSGSNILSFSLIYFLLKSYNIQNQYFFDEILIFFFLPLIDAARLFIVRVYKNGKPFFADNNHFHHLLLRNLGFFNTILITSLLVLFPHIGLIFKFNTILLFCVQLTIYLLLLYRFK
tara:strand:+ start:2144 stop:3142 length:999 start_codon:yes stop_codon:yes gene_type:complete